MAKVMVSEDVDYLPHGPETLTSVVLFSLRIGDVVDLNKWLPRAKLRSHVVLKLLCALVDSMYRFGPFLHDGVALKRKFGELVENDTQAPSCIYPSMNVTVSSQEQSLRQCA